MTIYALSTVQGQSGVAIVRVSGEDSKKVIQLLTGNAPLVPRVATVKKINKIICLINLLIFKIFG